MMLHQTKEQVESRGKQKEKIKVDIGMKEFYNYYCDTTFKEKVNNKSIVHKNSKFCVDRKVYGQIIDFIHSRITDEIIFDNFEFKLPSRMGTLCIKKKKPILKYNKEGNLINTMPIDWKATRELWEEDEESKKQKKLVRHLNEHTNGYVPFWYLSLKCATFKYKSAYKFKATRTMNRDLSKVLKDPSINTNYYLK